MKIFQDLSPYSEFNGLQTIEGQNNSFSAAINDTNKGLI